ncbi:DUF3461 family protein [Amphritea balenae]|uniref:DUF3461 family protein n=1 Tax=Amphritea balenae TaxID=452629 RepID=A0A3P1SRN0_9GAMM|nr:DUF3461 family protein [Amphritea balenae]RRC99295.1 DUF3461 family protein [Amphritea balenae]GGK72248.1 hypothetical protein GCM10007941_22870 [Amphritea balenae]
MSDYPTLNKMGIKSVESVDKYTLRHQGDTDVLKIYYKRAKGSLLSRSKKFSFVRGRKNMPLEVRNSKAFEKMANISPQLVMALEELKKLEATRKEEKPQDPKQKFLADLDHLEKVMNSKMDEIRRQINELD